MEKLSLKTLEFFSAAIMVISIMVFFSVVLIFFLIPSKKFLKMKLEQEITSYTCYDFEIGGDVN